MPIISVERFSYAYPSFMQGVRPPWVLNQIDLEVEAGEFVAIMGPAASGKSTLALAMNGIVPRSLGGRVKGRVLIDGLDTKDHSVADLARRVAFVFQNPEVGFLSLSVEAEVAFGLESLGLARDAMRERIAWALDLTGMAEYASRSPFNLSGGEKQRVAIASALAMRPQVLVLDEPTSNLDPQGKSDVFAVVENLRDLYATTILMVSHESERVAQYADRVLVLERGRVAHIASPLEVFRQALDEPTWGLWTPPVFELAQCMNSKLGSEYAFIRFEQALEALRSAASEREIGASN